MRQNEFLFQINPSNKMKNPILKYLFIFVFTAVYASPVCSQAQSNQLGIRGQLVDSASKAPLEFLTIGLLNSADSLLQTSLSKADGTFAFGQLKAGSYSIRIQGMGYGTKKLKLNLSDSELIHNLGVLHLISETKNLQTVNITAQKPLVKQDADKISYDLQADPQSKVSSVLEMMRKVPFIAVDADENIQLKGSSSYRVFINGRPSGLVERNPKDILRSMPASTIKSIEVITNPSAKYDGEGLAGIINIITIKQAFNGYQASLNLNGKTPIGGPGVGGTLSLKYGKLGLTALAGASRFDQPNTFSHTSRWAAMNYLSQESNRKSGNNTAYSGIELSYELDSLSLLSAQLNWSGNKQNGVGTVFSQSFVGNSLAQQYGLSNINQRKGSGLDATLNYQLGFAKNKNQLLTISYRYLRNTSDFNNDQNIGDAINYVPQTFKQTNEESLAEQTLQADYVQPLGKLALEAGLKGIFRKNNSDFRYFNHDGTHFTIDPSKSDGFNNNQNVYAFYNSYSYNVGKWQFRAGVRIEQTIINGNFNSGNQQVKQSYWNAMPNAALNRKLNDFSSLSLNYSKRIQRPAISQLNPFVDRSNPEFESTGNPALRPTTSDLIQLSYLRSKKWTFNIALGHIFFNSVIGQISTFDAQRNLTLTTYQNTFEGRIYKINIFLNYPLTKQWNVSLNSDLRHVDFYATVNQTTVNRSGAMAYVNVSTGYRLHKDWRALADFTMNTSGVSGAQSHTNGYIGNSFSISKDFVANKLTLGLTATNPFAKFRTINDELSGPGFNQFTYTKTYYRNFGLSLSYRFGKLQSEIKKNKRGIKNDDLQ